MLLILIGTFEIYLISISFFYYIELILLVELMFAGLPKVLRFQIKGFYWLQYLTFAFNYMVFNLIIVGKMIYLTLFSIFTCSIVCHIYHLDIVYKKILINIIIYIIIF